MIPLISKRPRGWFFKVLKTRKAKFMALSLCSECGSLEGEWRQPTLKEAEAHGMDQDDNDIEALVCCTCDTMGSYKGVPEHDDYDMER